MASAFDAQHPLSHPPARPSQGVKPRRSHPTASARPQLLTIRQVADDLQVSEKTIRRNIEARRLVATKVGPQWRVDPRDLDEFLRQGRHGGW